jgi:hypothetical protein
MGDLDLSLAAVLESLGSESEVEQIGRVLSSWAVDAQRALAELLDGTRSLLHRELLVRSAVAGHRLDALHAFARVLRSMQDNSLHREGLSNASDPLGSYLQRGHALPVIAVGEDDPEGRSFPEGSTWRGKPRS